MLPSLNDIGFGETLPVYIHKFRYSFWNSTDSLEQRANDAVARIFKDPENLYSFWRIGSDQDFYCVAASLNSGRGSPTEEIGFVWVTEAEMHMLELEPKPESQGSCLYSKKLHYDVLITPAKAYEFCIKLMSAGREVCRCKKQRMQPIVAYLSQKGCKAYQTEMPTCECQPPTFALGSTYLNE